MHHDQRLHVVVDLLGVGGDGADVVVLAELGERGPSLRGTAAHLHHHRVHRAADDVGERRHDAHDRPLGPRDARHEARDVVLERRLGPGRERAQGLLAVAAHGDQPEVDGRAEGIDRLRLYAVALGPLLRVRVGGRVVLLEDDVALCGADVFVDEVGDALRIRLERLRHFGGLLAHVVLEGDFALELSEHGLRAVGERV